MYTRIELLPFSGIYMNIPLFGSGRLQSILLHHLLLCAIPRWFLGRLIRTLFCPVDLRLPLTTLFLFW